MVVLGKSGGGMQKCGCGSGGGKVVVAELNFFSFARKQWTSGGGAVVRSSDVWWLADVRCLGDFGHGMNS